MVWQLQADHEQKQALGDVTITRGLDANRPITEELLHYLSPAPGKGRQAVWIEDVAATRTLITVEDLPSATLRDPDGHIIATQLW